MNILGTESVLADRAVQVAMISVGSTTLSTHEAMDAYLQTALLALGTVSLVVSIYLNIQKARGERKRNESSNSERSTVRPDNSEHTGEGPR